MLTSSAANAYILVSPKNMTALEGTRVRLVCQAEAHPGNVSYQWYRDGVDVHHVTGLMSRAGVYADGSFIISSVLRDDTGWYRCQPTNGIGPPPSAEAFLNVTCKSCFYDPGGYQTTDRGSKPRAVGKCDLFRVCLGTRFIKKRKHRCTFCSNWVKRCPRESAIIINQYIDRK